MRQGAIPCLLYNFYNIPRYLRGKLKIFIDTANIDEIKWANSLGIIDGVTTNPTIISREKRDRKELISEIARIVDGPISVEAMGTKAEDMIKEARELSKLASNISVKIPVTEEGLRAIKALSREGIKTTATLVFSPGQALLAAKAGATWVSPFIGRVDEAGDDGMQLLRDTLQVLKGQNFETQVVACSTRNPRHVIESAKAGVHAITIKPFILKRMLSHPQTGAGLRRFIEDWKKGFKI